MSFWLSKIVGALVAPGNLLLLLLLAGTILLAAGRRRVGFGLVATATAALLVVAVTPLGPWLLHGLETRFPRPSALPDRLDGIIVLGGAVVPVASQEYGLPQLNRHAERMTVLPGLMARYPHARVVFTGGSGDPLNQDVREAPVADALWRDMGLDTSRILFERESRNTWENAVHSKALAQPADGEVWLLVSSASHMPRSVGIFRQLGWPVVPYPVSWEVSARRLSRPSFSLVRNLDDLSAAVNEFVGLVSYHAMGRTDALYPAPDPAAALPP